MSIGLAEDAGPAPDPDFGQHADRAEHPPHRPRSPRRLHAVAEPTVARTPLRVPELSAREREVLRAWFFCDSKTEVAKMLFLSLGTVNTHLSRIRVKYRNAGRSAPTKAALVARALQDGIIDISEL